MGARCFGSWRVSVPKSVPALGVPLYEQARGVA